jgi:predicted Rossmann fold nucleotide-binding protein DprA/Smf involved in DNA uptake
MNAPTKPVFSLEPSLPIPEGIQLPIFQVMDDSPKTTDQVARRLGLPSVEVAVALSRLELNGHIRRETMGYCISAKGVELAEWMQDEA